MTPDGLMTMPNETNANALSISFASLLPRDVDSVGGFLSDAAFALCVREADLARMIGVSRATLSGWKARGSIPREHLNWFENVFPVKVVAEFKSMRDEDYRHAGIEPVLHLLKQTAFDPFALNQANEEDRMQACYWYFGGLVRLALFVQHRLPLEQLAVAVPPPLVTAKVLADILPGLASSLFPKRVSQ